MQLPLAEHVNAPTVEVAGFHHPMYQQTKRLNCILKTFGKRSKLLHTEKINEFLQQNELLIIGQKQKRALTGSADLF